MRETLALFELYCSLKFNMKSVFKGIIIPSIDRWWRRRDGMTVSRADVVNILQYTRAVYVRSMLKSIKLVQSPAIKILHSISKNHFIE